MGEKKLHYKMYKDGKKFVFAAIATMSFFVFGGVSTVAVHADTTSGNLTAATVNSTSDTKSAVSSAATVASSSSATKADSTSASSSAVKADSTGASSSAVKADSTGASSSAVKADSTSASSGSAVKTETTNASSNSATKADSTSASSNSATKADSTGASSSAVKADSTDASSSAVKADSTGASSSAVKADSANATSTNEYSASGSDTTSTDANGSSTKNRTAAVTSTKSLKTSSSLPSQISGFTVSVTASDGSTMNNGSSFNLSGQSAHLKAINLGFTLTQDGTLTPGSTIKIPVSVTNNSSDLVGSALSSGTSLDIQSVGTIQYQIDPGTRYGTSGNYIITIGNSFDQTSGKKVIATVTEKPGETSSLVTTNSSQNIVLTIGDNTFTFVPVKRIYEKDTGNYSSNDFAYSPNAGQINTGTTIKDPDYLNNALSGAENTPADTSIPTGNIINIERVTTGGSALTQVNLGKYIGSSTLQISEDGTYLIKNDNSAGKDFGQGSGVTSLITLPAGTSDDDILAALNKAGRHSGVAINEGNGEYTIAYNIGKLVGDGAYTYHDLYPNDDAATQADAAQEVNRTDDVNSKLNQKLATLYAFQNMGIQSEFHFADSSIKNTLQGTGTQYSVADDGTVTKVTSNNISSNTTPSNARSEGQFKVTVHYVDKDGKELATQAYSYGYPAGSSIAAQSPDYQVAPKDITGYTLVTSDSPVSSLNGKQLTTSEAVPFLANDQTVYYVYTKNAPTITTDKKTVNETIHYQGAGNQTPADHTASVDFTRQVTTDAVTGEKTYGAWSAAQSFDAVKSPELKGYTADKAQIDKQTVNGDSKDLAFTVTYTKNAPTITTEQKKVNETIHYQGAGNQTPADHTASVDFTRSVTTDAVTGEKTYGAWSAAQSFDAVKSPELKGYTADKAQIDKQTVNGDSKDLAFTVTYTKNAPTITTEQKKVNETIHYQGAGNQTPADHTASVDFTRSVTTDAVTGEKTYGAWSAAQSFDAVKSPELKGYTADKAQIDKQTVNGDSKDLAFTVTYTKNAPTITTEQKKVNETIHYQGAGNQTPADHTASVDFTRSVTTDAVTGEKTYGAWSAAQSFDAVKSPELKGYTADKAQIDKQTVNGDSKDLAFTVTYTKNAPTITTEQKKVNETIHYQGAGNQTPADHTASVDFTRSVTTDAVTGEKTYGAWSAAQSFDAVKSPELKGYTADKAQIDKQTVNGDSKDLAFTVTYTKNAPTITTEQKKVNETIHYQGAGNQTPADHTASVDFTRSVTTDAVTGEKTYGAWSAAQSFDAVKSPELKGYTADKAQIDKQTVNGDSKDLAFTVTYTKTPGNGTDTGNPSSNQPGNPSSNQPGNPSSNQPGNPSSNQPGNPSSNQPGNPSSNQPGNPSSNQPGNPSSNQPGNPSSNQPGNPSSNQPGNPSSNQPGNPSSNQPGNPSSNQPGNPSSNQPGNPSSNQPGNPSQPSNATNNGVINTSTNTGSKVNNGAVNSPELPQTGENNSQSQTMSFIGILLAMFGSLLGFLGIKKRRND